MKYIKVSTLIISAIALLPAVSFAKTIDANTFGSKPQLLAQVKRVGFELGFYCKHHYSCKPTFFT
jgi:hypothetical protein